MTNGTRAAPWAAPILTTMPADTTRLVNTTHSDVLALAAGIATIAAVAIASVLVVFGPAGDEVGAGLRGVHLGAIALFVLAFVCVAGPWRGAWQDRLAPWALAVAVGSASLAVATLPHFGLTPVLFILTTAIAAWVVNARAAWVLIALQTIVVLLSTLRVAPDPLAATVQTVAYGGFQVFALTTTLALLTERTLRRRLALANAELRATRSLLEASSRQGERLRIARELHDLVGHHLTALALHLEVADHLADARARESVERARAIARLLLADVREVVGDLRAAPIDLSARIRAMVADLPGTRIVLDLPERCAVPDEERAVAALRLVQEALTNALRHGEPDRIDIRLEPRPDALTIEVRDDGRGSEPLAPGNGLRGMRERIERAGGTLTLESHRGAGFRVQAVLPLEGTV